jgi:hypothetical protein
MSALDNFAQAMAQHPAFARANDFMKARKEEGDEFTLFILEPVLQTAKMALKNGNFEQLHSNLAAIDIMIANHAETGNIYGDD